MMYDLLATVTSCQIDSVTFMRRATILLRQCYIPPISFVGVTIRAELSVFWTQSPLSPKPCTVPSCLKAEEQHQDSLNQFLLTIMGKITVSGRCSIT